VRILIDSCVWSLALRRKDKTLLSKDERQVVAVLSEAVQNGQIAIVGPIRQEVLSGIKEDAQFKRLSRALASFPDTPIPTSHYEEAARLFNLCRTHGVECGAIDILICAVALRERWRILTTDGGLMRCIDVLRAEGAFH